MGRGFFIWASSVLLGCTLLLPTAASATTEFEMQLPQVFLEGIAYDLTVSVAATDPTAPRSPRPYCASMISRTCQVALTENGYSLMWPLPARVPLW